jgi:dTDP-glucose 4,6-dehydratase
MDRAVWQERSYSSLKTYGIPAVITRSCNNYGPFQNPEKFLPKCIINALENKPIPVYGDGSNVREWIHVLDHCTAIIRIMFYGKPGEIYNIGTGEEISNLALAKKVIKYTGKREDLIRFTDDRPAHDLRYALNSFKIRNHTKWNSKYSLEEGLKETIKWYENNRQWWKP